jgi:hypothetical protein
VAQDDYDKAAAEGWVGGCLKTVGRMHDQVSFAAQVKELLAQDEYRITGIYDDQRFDRHVRANLRKLARITNANAGFSSPMAIRADSPLREQQRVQETVWHGAQLSETRVLRSIAPG